MFGLIRQVFTKNGAARKPVAAAENRLRGPRVLRRRVKASLDIADSTYMPRHFTYADSLPPDLAVNATARQYARNRARYEIANNSYAKGILETLVNDIVGTGARLQMLLPGQIAQFNRIIELDFAAWIKAARFTQKYQAMKRAQKMDGESFGIMATNPAVRHPVKLDMAVLEAEQVCSPWAGIAGSGYVDGILYDTFGNPVRYSVKSRKPGGETAIVDEDYTKYSANAVIHRYRQDRPGQSRGYTEFAPCLPLFAKMRSFILSVVNAAQSAANFSWIMETDGLPGESTADAAWEEVELEGGMGMALPKGMKAKQMKAEQPVATFPEFKAELINEVARCLNIPYNIAAGNSSSYNYASGRLDHQTYFKSINVERAQDEIIILDPVFDSWWQEARLLPRYRQLLLAAPDNLPHKWFYDGREHVDPAKEANAQEKRLKNMTTSLATEYAKQGQDWEQEIQQIARERELLKSLDITVEEAAPESAAVASLEERIQEIEDAEK